jgi:hypothetical protein
MDPFNSETWKQQWAAFWRAPFIMLPLILVAVVVTWQVIEAVHGTEIAGKDATIEALREEVTSYKNKLSGASPDQAKAQIDEAKAKIDGLEARLVKLEPRTLSAQESSIISSSLKASGISAGDIRLASDDGCADCAQYAASFKEALKVTTWSILREELGGNIRMGSPKGVAIVTQDPSNPLPEAKALADALVAAKIPFDTTQNPNHKDEHPVWLLITQRPQD